MAGRLARSTLAWYICPPTCGLPTRYTERTHARHRTLTIEDGPGGSALRATWSVTTPQRGSGTRRPLARAGEGRTERKGPCLAPTVSLTTTSRPWPPSWSSRSKCHSRRPTYQRWGDSHSHDLSPDHDCGGQAAPYLPRHHTEPDQAQLDPTSVRNTAGTYRYSTPGEKGGGWIEQIDCITSHASQDARDLTPSDPAIGNQQSATSNPLPPPLVDRNVTHSAIASSSYRGVIAAPYPNRDALAAGRPASRQLPALSQSGSSRK